MDLTLDPGVLKAAHAALRFRTQAFIDGKYSPSAGGKTYTSVNPANGTPLAEIADCGPEDVETAVRAARRHRRRVEGTQGRPCTSSRSTAPAKEIAMDLRAIQAELQKTGLDGWLFFDHHERDPLAYSVLGLKPPSPVTRRWYSFVPGRGKPLFHKKS